MNFVRREDPLVLPMIEAMPATGTLGDAVDWLGITESEFGRMRGRLGQLAKCFQSGEQVPRQRKPYKRRVVRSKELSGSHPNWTLEDISSSLEELTNALCLSLLLFAFGFVLFLLDGRKAL